MALRCLHVFSTFAAGGPQVRTARLVAGLGADFEHAFLALDGRTEARELLPGDVSCEVLEPLERVGALANLRRMRGLIRERRPDLVLTYNWGAIEAVMAAVTVGGQRVLHHEDGFLPDELHAFKKRREWTRRLVLPRTQAVVVPSHRLERIATARWGLRAEHVRLIPNGIDVDPI